MTTKELDNFGGQILNDLGTKSAPYLTYGFSGWTCISVNNVGNDVNQHQKLIEASKQILYKAIHIKDGVRISDIGCLIETEAKKRVYKVIKNLTGHGIGRSLHEEPSEIANFKDKFNLIETFISKTSTYAETLQDDWTMVELY